MFDSLSKQLKARRLINQRAPHRRADEIYLAPRQRWYYAATRGGSRRETTFDTPLPAIETP